MGYKDKSFLWILGIITLCMFIYSISSILLPFVVAVITAYFLNPAANNIQKSGISRTLATTIITVLFFVAVATAVILLAPIFYNQFMTFLHTVPTYADYVNEKILPEFSKLIEKIDPNALEKAKDSVSGVSGAAIKFMATLAGNIWSSSLAVVNLLSLFFITPIVTFYMLRDWDKILSSINNLLPPKHAEIIRMQAKAIDRTLAGFIRGQTHVCLILGAYYAIALTFAGLEFGLFIGLATGLLLFIPYVGVLFGFIVGILVAFFQFGDAAHISMVAIIFLIGQALEGVFITPNLVGNKVGLHPVWIMFGLLAGGAMFGLLGILVAVPITAVIGVLARFFIGEYLKSHRA